MGTRQNPSVVVGRYPGCSTATMSLSTVASTPRRRIRGYHQTRERLQANGRLAALLLTQHEI